MELKNKISTKQIFAVYGVILGILTLIFKTRITTQFLEVFSVFLILFSLSVFVSESKRRYQITHPFKKNNYDSKQEESVADYFKRKNIIFIHHPEIKLHKYIFDIIAYKTIKLEPDFYLPEFDVYVEYWGMMDTPEYKKKYDYKKKLYVDNLIDFVSIYRKNLDNLDFAFTSKLLEIFKEREGNSRKYR